MSTTSSGQQPKARLVEMQVEEVSLVDRAANKKRFLIVKRDDPMETEDDKTPETTDPTAAPAAEGGEQTPPPEDPEAQKAEGEMPPEGGAPAGGECSPLESAVSALTVLNEVVNTLGALGGSQTPEDNAQLAALAASLVEIGQSIIDQTGGAPAPAAAPPAAEPPADPNATKSADHVAKLEEARKLIEQMKSALSKSAKVQKAAEPIDMAKAVADINASLKNYGEVLKDVQGRVARVEKSVGAPASTQPESVTKRAPSEVSWPQDLNAITSRESAK